MSRPFAMQEKQEKPMSTTTGTATKHDSPIVFLVLGVLCLAFWILASLLQIQTSEAFLLHGATVSFMPNWSVVMQPVLLMQGQLSPSDAKAALWGWGIELIYLVCVIGFEVSHDAVSSANRKLANWFKTGAMVLIAFDAYTDFSYGSLASGFWGQIAFAGITAFIVLFFGVVGLRLIEHGFAEFTRP